MIHQAATTQSRHNRSKTGALRRRNSFLSQTGKVSVTSTSRILQPTTFSSGLTSGNASFFEAKFAASNLKNIGCFGGLGTKLTEPTAERVEKANSALLNYACDVLTSVKPNFIELNVCDDSIRNLRAETNRTNVCVSPLQAARGWGILLNAAQGKTESDVTKFVQNLIGEDENVEIEDSLINLHVDIEEDVPNAVRLFSELQPSLFPRESCVLKAAQYYNGKSKRPPIVFKSFASDHDGLSIIHEINEEISLATSGRLTNCVKEKGGPNCRSQMLAVSAIDCTFHWKAGSASVVNDGSFYSSSAKGTTGISYTPYITAASECKQLKKGDVHMLELPHHFSDFKLYLFKHDGEGLSASKMLEYVGDLLEAAPETATIAVPCSVISSPVCLSEQANRKSGLWRLFDKEKSQLNGFYSTVGEAVRETIFIALWEHYHKAVFQNFFPITTDPPSPPPKEPIDKDFRPGNAFISLDPAYQGQIANTNLSTEDYSEFLLPYHENHLAKHFEVFHRFRDTDNNANADKRIREASIVFDSPFDFLVLREIGKHKTRLVFCCGRFNNAPGLLRDSNDREHPEV
ncbi:unnamed protein product [Caenorhabditis auriculariae]|uniref:Uncharacterized protein n=1 Tax=Caenorhabditis auriculariae TaxID=2777116 RepID=A0A8S1HI92_9PELO|nr:unnamed protein product [Caenorhabditis auriculariae]